MGSSAGYGDADVPGNDLVLLTSEYPFGTTGETFLEAELPILAERFGRIYVLPSTPHSSRRPLPGNAELVRMGWLDMPGVSRRLGALLDRRAAQTLWRSAGTYREFLAYRKRIRVYADVLARNVLKARELNRWVRGRGLQRAVFYDYWFENSTLALSICRLEGALHVAVARAHGFDLYDEGFGGTPVPFRQAKARGLDAVFPVSEHGRSYLTAHVPALAEKLAVHRLGVVDPGRIRPEPDGGCPLVVSCAALVPEKRIHLIPAVLATVGSAVRWIHIGDGPERARVLAAARTHLDAESWRLAGEVTHAEVLQFYEQNPVGALLSVSSSEGAPVSMMEAQSYGVPVVACDVGAVGEIVRANTGCLLPSDANPEEIARALSETLTPGRFDPWAIRRAWQRRYDGAKNYEAFADALVQLSEAKHRVG